MSLLTPFKKIGKKIRDAFTEAETIEKSFGENLTIGVGSIIRAGSICYFNPKYSRLNRKCICIGERSLIQANFTFEHNAGQICIGDNVYMGGVSLMSRTGITIGNNVTMAWGIIFYDHDAHSVNWSERQYDNERCFNDFINHKENLNFSKDWSVVKSKEIVVEDNVWIGFDALILKGVTIGEGAVVAAKSVVTKDVPPYSLVAGNPAQLVKNLNH